jgi:tetratricopeptide (TPR) repeat protein
MILQWFNARQATEHGAVLADKLTPSAARIERPAGGGSSDGASLAIVNQAVNEIRDLQLNFYQRARLANAFKWRLIENGIERQVADQLTKSVVLDLSANWNTETTGASQPAGNPTRRQAEDVAGLLEKGKRLFERGDYPAALRCYEQLLRVDNQSPEALNNVGSVLFKLGRLIEAERHFRHAVTILPEYPDALVNLGIALRVRGYFSESELYLRRAIKAKPNHFDAHCVLGSVLAFMGDSRGAKARFKKVLRAKPGHVDSLIGMAHALALEGRMDEASGMLDRVRAAQPNYVRAIAAQAGLRKMQSSDSQWLEAALSAADSETDGYEEAALRFSIGKYYDDVGNYARAFDSYKRANDGFKRLAEPYDRKRRTKLVRDLISAYPREETARQRSGSSHSSKPVLVVGMPRSGTSLVDQIICSHPAAKGVGESQFWSDSMREHESRVRVGSLDEQLTEKLAGGYLQTLEARARDALRIVDKTPLNAEYLGVIHSVFPNARFIYMRRDPIDTCLSNYFQAFPLTANFKLDLADLAHFWKEHRRLIDHWRAALSSSSILEVPYEELVADQETWTRRILDFIGLEWNDRCLNFNSTQRVVATASYWQVRQKIYNTSVGRSRNYQKFLGPLLELRDR